MPSSSNPIVDRPCACVRSPTMFRCSLPYLRPSLTASGTMCRHSSLRTQARDRVPCRWPTLSWMVSASWSDRSRDRSGRGRPSAPSAFVAPPRPRASLRHKIGRHHVLPASAARWREGVALGEATGRRSTAVAVKPGITRVRDCSMRLPCMPAKNRSSRTQVTCAEQLFAPACRAARDTAISSSALSSAETGHGSVCIGIAHVASTDGMLSSTIRAPAGGGWRGRDRRNWARGGGFPLR